MQYFYAFGLWDSIVNGISKAFSWLFNVILRPVLEGVFTAVVKPVVIAVLDLLYQMLKDVFLAIFQYLLLLLDIIEQAFNIFAGTAEVTIHSERDYLINVVIGQSGVSRAFWSITLIAFVMCMIFSVVGVLRSAMDLEGKRPVGKVLASAAKAMLSFLLVPFVIIASINLSSAVLKGSTQAIEIGSGQSGATIGTHVFLAVISNYLNDSVDPDVVRTKFLNKELNYASLDDVKSVINQKTVKYENGIIASLVIGIMMAIACFMFVRRIFEIVILYVVSPFFVSTMPLDDGGRFKSWRELFIAKVVSGFGTVYAMKIYIMLLPLLTGPAIVYFEDPMANSLMQLIFMCGGSYAVVKSQGLIMQAVNPQVAAQDEQAVAGFKKMAGKALAPAKAIKKHHDEKSAAKKKVKAKQKAKAKDAKKNAKKAGKPDRKGGKTGIQGKINQAKSFKNDAKGIANKVATAPRQIKKIPESIGIAAGGAKYAAHKSMKVARAFGSGVKNSKVGMVASCTKMRVTSSASAKSMSKRIAAGKSASKPDKAGAKKRMGLAKTIGGCAKMRVTSRASARSSSKRIAKGKTASKPGKGS